MAEKQEQKLLSPLSTPGDAKYLSFVFHRYLETAVWTFAELGIADLFAAASEPQTADELAHSQGWNSEFLYRVLCAVVDAGILSEIQNNDVQSIEPAKTHRFKLTEDGYLLTSNHPSKARYILRWELSPLLKMSSNYLPELVRKGYADGNGLDQITGHRPLFDFLKDEKNRELSNCFDQAMTHLSNASTQPIANAFDFSKFTTLVDIGGSLGTVLAAILAKYPTIQQGICFDLPHVVQHSIDGCEFKQRNISKDRYRFVGGDMFDAKTIPQADAYIMKNIVHDWDDQHCIAFLKALRQAINDRPATLLIIEFIILSPNNDNQAINWYAHGMDLHMMVNVNGKERSEVQHKYLLEQCGFSFKQLHRTASPVSIIEATANH